MMGNPAILVVDDQPLNVELLEACLAPQGYQVLAAEDGEAGDGSGYPLGLEGERIPVEGRILNIADQYDALRNQRPYKPALDHPTAYAIIADGDGRTLPQHFDPAVLRLFKQLHGRFEEIYELRKDAPPKQG